MCLLECVHPGEASLKAHSVVGLEYIQLGGSLDGYSSRSFTEVLGSSGKCRLDSESNMYFVVTVHCSHTVAEEG